MEAVHEGLDAVRRELARLDRPVVGLLNPGLPAEAVREHLPDAPAEILSWYAWADGTREEPDQLIDEAAFIPGYVLVTLAEALEFRKEVDMRVDEGLDWLPVLISPAADFYAIVWGATPDAQAVGYVQGTSQPAVYRTVPLLLRTLTENYRTGAFDVDDEGYLDMHAELCDRVYSAING